MENQNPIFIVGCERSGTTLLRMMLDSHRDIACGPEFSIMTENLARRWGRVNWPCIESLTNGITLNTLANFGLTKQDAVDAAAAYVHTLFSRYAATCMKPRWAVKTPRYIEKLDFLHSMFPAAFFIHIIRDGRDVVASCWKEHTTTPEWHPNSSIGYFAAEWHGLINTGRRLAAESNISNYYEIHYEHLIDQPRDAMQNLLEFVQAPWDEAVLNHHKMQHDISPTERSTPFALRSIYRDRVGYWRDYLIKAEIDEMLSDAAFVDLLRAERYLEPSDAKTADYRCPVSS